MPLLPPLYRARSATLTAIAGGALAQSMALWGGTLARFLPPWHVLILAAMLGAGMAGFLLADAFGRAGVWGAVWSAVGWICATVVGAGLGAAVFTFSAGAYPAFALTNAVVEGAPLGLLAVGDGISSSPTVALIWIIGGCAVHYGTRTERAAVT